MKVLQIGKFYPILGGVEKVMWDLTRGLSADGVDCDMLCACLPADMPEGGVIRFNEHGRVICRRAWKKVAATMLCPGMVTWLRKHSNEYDIVHVHHPDPMACLALWLSGYRGHVALHWHSDILKQKVLLKFYAPLQSWLIRRADKIIGTTPVYVAESPFLAEVQSKVTYLPIGVDPVPKKDCSAEEGAKTVFSLGRLVGYKGYSYLIEAAAMLPPEYRVVIAGSGPLKDELQQQIDSLGLRDRVSLIGRISEEEKYEWFRRCDIFCLSSVWKTEAFAIVQVEAMSCGTPVVATRIPGSGVSWVNKDGVSGINVPVEDARALADAILAVTSYPEAYSRFSDGARERYLECFTLEKMVGGCKAIYDEFINDTDI